MKKITFLFCFLCISLTINAQDTCSEALPLSLGTTTVSAIDGSDVPDPICAVNGPVTDDPAGEWYTYTSTQNEVITITTDLIANEDGDTRLHIYEGACGTLTCLDGSDDLSDSNFLSRVTFLAEQGVTYFVAFDNRWSADGFDFEVISDIPNCQNSTPLTENFDSSVYFIGCLSTIDGDGDGIDWIQQELTLSDGAPPSFFATNGLSDTSKEDYLFSPAISLIAGTTYEITALYNGVDSEFGNANENLEIIMADNNNIPAVDSGTSIFSDNGIAQNGTSGNVENEALTASGQFTPNTSGDYHIVFKSTGTPLPPGFTTGYMLLFDYSIQETLSTNDFEAYELNYFVDNSILTLEANQTIDQVEIYNMLGQIVKTTQPASNTTNINLSEINKGIYIAKIEIAGQTQTFKFVK